MKSFFLLFLLSTLLLCSLQEVCTEAHCTGQFEKRTIVLFGRTGSGKSALGNKIMKSIDPKAEKDLFEEGGTLESATSEPEVKSVFSSDLHMSVNVVDTPGFSDNREGQNGPTVLAKIMKFVKGLEGGFNVAVYCVPVTKTRFEGYDAEELKTLGMLLGNGIFKHMIIALTRGDILQEDVKKTRYEAYMRDLPGILESNGFSGLAKESIHIAEFQYLTPFLTTLQEKLQTDDKYFPELPFSINLDDEKSIEKFMATSYWQNVSAFFEKLYQDMAERIQRILTQVSNDINYYTETKKSGARRGRPKAEEEGRAKRQQGLFDSLLEKQARYTDYLTSAAGTAKYFNKFATGDLTSEDVADIFKPLIVE